MELCTITSKGYWDKMYDQDCVMLLTHLALKYPEYTKLATQGRGRFCYKYLDNSLIEAGESLSIKDVFKAAAAVQPDCIILPDVFKDGAGTIAAIEEATKWLEANELEQEYCYMGVCHGKDKKEFQETYEYLNAHPYITHIGIPKVITTWTSRASLFDIWGSTEKYIHFLGAWESLAEIRELPDEVRAKVTSIDTCLPELIALQGKAPGEEREGTIDLEEEYRLDLGTYKKVMDVANEWCRIE